MLNSIPRIVQLLWAPGRLASVAVDTTVTAAAIVGMAAIVFHLTLAMLYIVALSDAARYYTSVWQYLAEAARTVVPAILLGVLFVYFVILIGRTAYNYRSQLSLKILLLSPVTLILPVMVYSIFLLLSLADVRPASWLDEPLLAFWQLIVAVLGACWWTPVLFGAWLWFWQRAARQVEQLTPAGWPLLCQNCGCDLRGTISAEGNECPQCGRQIPSQILSALE